MGAKVLPGGWGGGGKWIKCHLRCFHQDQGPGNGLGRKREIPVRERGKVLISGGESKVCVTEKKKRREQEGEW